MILQPNKETEYQTYVSNNSADPYSKGVVDYTETWAELMEEKLATGAKLEDIASETSYKANTDGITGFMYGCAVKALSQFWIHGEALRRWHNKDVQIRDEGDKANDSGGVLNPALFTISL